MNIAKKIIKKINRYKKTRRSKLIFYKFDKSKQEDNKSAVGEFIDIGDFESLKRYSVEHNGAMDFFLNSECANRFEKGSILCVASTNDEWVAYGWIALNNDFWIAEIDRLIDLRNSKVGILYDFYTKENYRGLGIYSAVISHLNELCPCELTLIYCYENNISSRNGIKKAGGIYEAEFKHNSKDIIPYFQLYNINLLGSNLKMFGLKYAKNESILNLKK